MKSIQCRHVRLLFSKESEGGKESLDILIANRNTNIHDGSRLASVCIILLFSNKTNSSLVKEKLAVNNSTYLLL